MGLANGSAVQTYYVEEVAGAIPATPAWKPIRFVSAGLTPNINQIDTAEMNQTRQRPPSRGGTYSVAGDIAVELSFASFDDLIQAAMQGTWAVRATKTAITLSAASADNSFNDSGTGFVTAGFVAGEIITVSGFVTGANNGTFKTVAVTAGKITVTKVDGSPAGLVVEAATPSVTIVSSASTLKIGKVERSFAILERHTDIGVDYVYHGCRVSTMAISSPLNAPVGVTFSMMGTKAEKYTVPVGSTYLPATATDIMITTNLALTEGGVSVAYATEWSVSLDNGMEALFALGSREAFDVSNGIAVVTGSMSAYLVDAVLWDKVLDETSTSHVIEFTEGADKYTLELPKVRYTQGQKQTSGPGAIIPQYTVSAGYDDVLATTMMITRTGV